MFSFAISVDACHPVLKRILQCFDVGRQIIGDCTSCSDVATCSLCSGALMLHLKVGSCPSGWAVQYTLLPQFLDLRVNSLA